MMARGEVSKMIEIVSGYCGLEDQTAREKDYSLDGAN